MQLEGKRTLITGAGSGIGRAAAIEASRRGMTVALCGRRVDALRETVALMQPGAGHLVLPADVTVPALRRRLKSYLSQCWGGLDVLVNNAGLVAVGPLIHASDEDILRVMATNIVAPAALTREMLPLLRKAAPSRIVNIGSMFGDIAYPLVASYSASKFALRGLSTALRRELKPFGIGVTYASPRGTRTDAANAFDPLVEPMQMRFDEPENVAARLWRAVEREADTAYARGPERLFVLIERLFPGLVDRPVARQMADTRVQAYLSDLSRFPPVRTRAIASDDVEPGSPCATVCATDEKALGPFSPTLETLEISKD
jgi:NAD(P)-dependent dehydrogenase (short-subunit alcohol dehydrogenase family)